MSRVTAPRGFHCDKSANGMKPDVKLLRRAAERVSAHLSLFRRAAAQQLQNVLGNVAFLATAANEPPVAGPFHHLFDDRGKDGKDGKDTRTNRASALDTRLNQVPLGDAQLAVVPGREVVNGACVQGGLAGAETSAKSSDDNARSSGKTL